MSTTADTGARYLRAGLLAGLGAGAAMGFFSVVLRFALDAPFIQEIMTDKVLELTPPALFEFFLERLGSYAKPLLFLSLSLAMSPFGGAIGGAYGWLASRRSEQAFQPSPWHSLFLTAGLWALFTFVAAPIAGVGFFGREALGGGVNYTLAAFVASGVYGMAMPWLFARLTPAPAEADDTTREPKPGETRRLFLRRVLIWSAVVGVVAFGLRTVSSGISRMSFSAGNPIPPGQMPPVVTPNDMFYVVSKNVLDPELHVEAGANGSEVWNLQVDGLASGSYTLSHAELVALPSVEEYVTLECISNLVGGHLISNAHWKGVRLRDLLERAGGAPEGTLKIVFRAADNYSSSIPLSVAMEPEVILAYEMNGEPLPPSHGFPARLLVPGRYGMKSVKWVTRIEAVDYDHQGYWEERGWSDECIVKTTSVFLVPRGGATPIDGPLPIGGIAYSGARGIDEVEISPDDGETWHRMSPDNPLSPYTWVLWTGHHELPLDWQGMLLVRARDGDGELQTDEVAPPAPDGASGYHSIGVRTVLPDGLPDKPAP